MSFYLEALDKQEKKENESSSVGIILCASKDAAIVEYAMSHNSSPIAVAEYSTKLIDKKTVRKEID